MLSTRYAVASAVTLLYATIIAGCAAPTPTPVPTATATPMSIPTPTPTPTPCPDRYAHPHGHANPNPDPAPTATPTPLPTPTPAPEPVLFASERVRDRLFDPACSGLFRSHAVVKSAAMGTGAYWVDARLPARTQEVIRTQVMPELVTWTHREWCESEEPAGALQWYEGDA